MGIKDTIQNLADAMLLLEQLGESEYLEANGISPEEVPEMLKVAEELIKNSQEEAKPFIEWRLKQRQDSFIFASGLQAEIDRLQELKRAHEKRISSADRAIDYLLKLFGIEKMQTELNELSYRKSEAVVFTDEALIPEEYKIREMIENIKISKADLKKAIKSGTEVPGVMLEIRQNLQIK